MKSLPALFLLLLVLPAQAAVYKCAVDGRSVYSDKPCKAGDAPARLPAITSMQATKPSALSKQYDKDLSDSTKKRDKADAAFVKENTTEVERQKAVRTAIIEHRVIKHMKAAEVKSVLGEPDSQEVNGRWVYRRDGKLITVTFGEDGVSAVTSKSDKPKKSHARHRR
jgi:hypothetical protein